MSEMLEIRWNNHERIDLVPYEWFRKTKKIPKKSHDTADQNRNHRVRAKCSVEISKNQAKLDYGGVHREYNNRNDMDIGTLRITFDDGCRRSVYRVEWRGDEKGAEFTADDIKSFKVICLV